jgi:hypothetical protein
VPEPWRACKIAFAGQKGLQTAVEDRIPDLPVQRAQAVTRATRRHLQVELENWFQEFQEEL